MIRLANIYDVDEIEKIYDGIHTAQEQGVLNTGWVRNVYPVRKTALDAIARGDLFVMEEENRIVASAIINQIQVDVYSDCTWQYPAKEGEVMVLHTLTVDPNCAGKGYGTEFVRYYERYALAHGCSYLRMDTQQKNIAARKLYQKLGYCERGIVHCVFNGIPGVQLVCLEKKL